MPLRFAQIKALAKNEGLKIYRIFAAKKKAAAAKAVPVYSFELFPHDRVKPRLPSLTRASFVGERWRDNPELPVALMMGFKNPERGAVSDQLTEYRTAFLPLKIGAVGAAKVLTQSTKISKVLIIWGYGEPSGLIVRLARFLGYSVQRAGDGFIHSLRPRTANSIPYSVIVDKAGVFSDQREPSDLESILATDRRLDDEAFLSIAESRRKTMISLKHQAPIGAKAGNVFRKEVVLVIGQDPSDPSFISGNPARWTADKLVSLAKSENPGCEVIYLQHSDGYQINRSNWFKRRISSKVKPSKISLLEALEGAKRAYTVSSSGGLEALARGVEVTTVGIPFYAGWGATDDRCKGPVATAVFARRERKLTTLQIFAGAYLLYPKYLASRDNRFGLTAACMKLVGDRYLAKPALSLSKLQASRENRLREMAKSSDWMTPLDIAHLPKLNGRDRLVFVRNLNYHALFADNTARIYQIALICRIVGLLSSWNEIKEFLQKVKAAVPANLFKQILQLPFAQKSGEHLLRLYAGYLEDAGLVAEAKEVLQRNFELSSGPADNRPVHLKRMSAHEASSLLSLVQFNFRVRRMADVFEGCYELLVSNFYFDEVMQLLIGSANVTFEFASSTRLAEFHLRTGAPKYYGSNLSRMLEDLRFVQPFDGDKFISVAMANAIHAPASIDNILLLTDRMEERCGVDDFSEILFSMMALDKPVTIEKAKAWIIFERPEKALPILREIIQTKGESMPLLIALSQAYSYLGEFQKARGICERAVQTYEHVNTYREAMRVAVVSGDIAWGEVLIDAAKARGIDVGEMSLRKILNGARRIHEAVLSQRAISPHRDIKKNYPIHYTDVDKVEGDFSGDNVFFVNVFGPGDEVRAAQIYSDIAADPSFAKFSIACDPRLLTLMERSFPDLSFVPVARVLRHGVLKDIRAYTELPAYDLRYHLDNNGHRSLLESDRTMLVVDLIAKYRQSYGDFHGESYLKVDKTKAAEFRGRLPNGKKLVGINWRSSVSTFSRNLHYLTIEELAPVFEIEGLQFVNLQYDECSAELAWVEERYPGKIIHFADLDQFDDIDGVAALMSTLDLVVAPATTVAELAGACGVSTWLLSNTTELDGRKISEDSLVDIWHNSMIHIEGEARGDKRSLVKSLCGALQKFAR